MGSIVLGNVNIKPKGKEDLLIVIGAAKRFGDSRVF